MAQTQAPLALPPAAKTSQAALILAAIGIVFGDIGTSPLYTLSACFTFSGASPKNFDDALGIASLLIWALILVVCVKYIGFILPVDHDGEGGILALLALGNPSKVRGRPVAGGLLTVIVVIGAAMLIGDGSITPAISVISAIEGIRPLSPLAEHFIVPISIAILVGIFAMQRFGTGFIGRVFGPVMILWFGAIALAGSLSILQKPEVLLAFNPTYAIEFFMRHGVAGFWGLGGVVLAVTGVEALYADLSHFGRAPIFRAWYLVVFPALILCYLGETAAVLRNSSAVNAPLYALTPGMTLIPMIVLATLATIIASQALISGAFTLVEQAIALGLAPRLRIVHTSAKQRGQVYIPAVNYLLGIGCILLVGAFGSSDKLTAAYGLAVSCTMLATSIAWFVVVKQREFLLRPIAVSLLLAFISIDVGFIAAGLPKFRDGGWIPFLISAVLTALTLIWVWGRRRLFDALNAGDTPLADVLTNIASLPAVRTPPVVILTNDPTRVPLYTTHPWVSERLNMTSIVLMHINAQTVPRIPREQRVSVRQMGPRVFVVEARVGYMETPRMRPIVRACAALGLDLAHKGIMFAYTQPVLESIGHRSIVKRFSMSIFTYMLRNARRLSDDLEIPAAQRIVLGAAVKL